MVSLQRLIEALRRRKFSRWLIGYAAAAWGLAEATGFLVDTYGAPRRLIDVVLFLLLVCLFVLIVLVWHHGERGPQRITRREGGLLGALLTVENGTISRAALAIAGANQTPYRLTQAEQSLVGQPASEEAFKGASEIARDQEAMSDAYIDSGYRQRLAGVLTERALKKAAARAAGE